MPCMLPDDIATAQNRETELLWQERGVRNNNRCASRSALGDREQQQKGEGETLRTRVHGHAGCGVSPSRSRLSSQWTSGRAPQDTTHFGAAASASHVRVATGPTRCAFSG